MRRATCIILAVLLGLGASFGYARQRDDTADREKRVKEIRLEASWYGFSPDLIIVKKGDIVRLSMTSRDVPHGVNISAYGIDVRVEKGKIKHEEFTADKAGEFVIKCSVYCGAGHNSMRGKLIVEEK